MCIVNDPSPERNIILPGKEISGKGGSVQNSKNSFRGVSRRMAENTLELMPSWYWHFKENFQGTCISVTERPILKQPTVGFWGAQVIPLWVLKAVCLSHSNSQN